MNLCIGTTALANKLLQIVKTMQKFSLLPKDDAIIQSYANHVARMIHEHYAEKSRQARLEIIFQLKINKD